MEERQGLTLTRRARVARELSPDESPYLTAARAIADDLAASATRSDAGVCWHGDDLAGTTPEDAVVVHGPVGPALYSGSAGMAWFLGHLAAATGDRLVARTAVEALQAALVEARTSTTTSLFSGRTGIAWAAVDVAQRLGVPDLARDALALARQVADDLEQWPDERRDNDLLAGLAGVVIGLLAISQRVSARRLSDAAAVAASQLASASTRDAFGAHWPDPSDETAPGLCGLGHGASGAAWALAEAGWSAGAPDVTPLVQEALRYERGWFSPERCAWADLRGAHQGGTRHDWPAWTSAWCHGAFGIGAFRWRLYEKTRDRTALAEASASIEAARTLVAHARQALRAGIVSDVTLCHGLGGAIELMLLAYEVTGERDHLVAARRAGDLCLAIRDANQRRWTVGLRKARHVPGLFTGLAGIGVTMLRLHEISAVASPMLPGRPRRHAA